MFDELSNIHTIGILFIAIFFILYITMEYIKIKSEDEYNNIFISGFEGGVVVALIAAFITSVFIKHCLII